MRLQVMVVFWSIINCTYSQTDTLIKDYLNLNNLHAVLLISCKDQYNVNLIETIFTLQHHRFWINVLDISNQSSIDDFDYDNFFIRLSNTHCVVVDLDCNETNKFLEDISNRIMFHYERNWLIISSDFNKSFDILSQQNINIDSEVSLAIPEPETNRQNYDIYEVYNPSSKHGGQLNMTRLGYWNKSTGLIIAMNQTKIERRRDLQGITFSSIITVMENVHKN